MSRTATTPMVARRTDQSADDDPFTHSESDQPSHSANSLSELPFGQLPLPDMSSNSTEGAVNAALFEQIIRRLRQSANEDGQQADQTNAEASILRRHTPERPPVSPIESDFTPSRPSSTKLPEARSPSNHLHPQQQPLDSLQSRGEYQPFYNLSQNPIPGTDFADADLLASLTASTHLASAATFEQPPEPSSKIMDDLLQDGVEELGQPTVDLLQKAHDSGRVEAFAKLEFADGFFYMTTSSLELGRDERVYKAAQEKARETQLALRERPASSSGHASHRPEQLRRAAGSQVKGSIISERGGFCAVDAPKAASEPQLRPSGQDSSHSSQISASSVVKMEDLEIHPPVQRFEFDYQKLVDETNEGIDDEQPVPVTTAHMPKLESNPLIPIHPMTDNVDTEIGILRSVSRRHARIAWNEMRQCFEITVMGRNGAFLNEQYLKWKSVRPITDNSRVAISGIEFTFRLPFKHADSSDESEAEEDQSPKMPNQSATPTSEDVGRSLSPSANNAGKPRPNYKTLKKPTAVATTALIGPDGQPMPPKKRGPGRPPKDGIMSNRERREIAKTEKARQAREANGGVTPPPTGRGSIARASIPEVQVDQIKSEKRKYNKRKRGEDGELLQQSIEDGQIEVLSDEEAKPSKKSRASRSPSPIYPAKETLTEEQMAKPQDNYARLIYDILNEIHPQELGLRQIYRQLKLKYPYFVHKCTTDGWQSSVRHNLNSEFEKIFDKGKKDGKGWAWKSIPGKFMESKEDVAKKRKAQEAAQAEAKAKAAAKTQFHPGPHPPQWQHGPPFPHPQGMQPQFAPYFGPNPGMPPPLNGMQWGPPPQGSPIPPPPSGGNKGGLAFNPQHAHGMPYPPLQMQNGQYYGPPPPNAHQHPQPPSRSGSVQQQGSQLPSAPQQVVRPAQATASSLPSNMPCTLAGIEAIEVFRATFISEEKVANLDRFHSLFHSARRRVLHGADDSYVAGDERDREHYRTIVELIEQIAAAHRNPNYVKAASATSTPAPMPVPVTKEVNQEKTDGGEKGIDSVEDGPIVDEEKMKDEEKVEDDGKAAKTS